MTLLEEVQKDYSDAKQGKTKRKPRAKPKPKVSASKKIYITLFLMGLAIAGVFFIAESYHDWRESHEWQFPVRWIGFVKDIERKIFNPLAEVDAQEIKQLTDMEIIEQYYLSPVLKSVYFLESTSGQNDGCKDEGKINGFGYRQNTAENKCYDTFEDVVEKVNEWYEERLSMNGNDLVEAVCFYNTGVQGQQVCDYSVNFMGVITDNF